MLSVEYSKLKGVLYVKNGKTKQEIRTNGTDVNNVALYHLKKYFIDTIQKLCGERSNVYGHIYVNMSEKDAFFSNIMENIENQLKLATWKDYLVRCFKNLRLYSPSVNSRFYHNYMSRVEMMESVLGKYLNKEKFYTELNEQTTIYLFDNQQFTQHHYD